MQRSVNAMTVVMLDELLQHLHEVAGPGGQQVVKAFVSQGAD